MFFCARIFEDKKERVAFGACSVAALNMPMIALASMLWQRADSVSFLSCSVRSVLKYRSYCLCSTSMTFVRLDAIISMNNDSSTGCYWSAVRVSSDGESSFPKKSVLQVRVSRGFSEKPFTTLITRFTIVIPSTWLT